MQFGTLLPTAAVVLTALAPSAVAHADPPGGTPFELSCDVLGPISIVTPPTDRDWTPGLLVDGNRVLVPYAFEFVARGYVDGSEGPEDPDFVETTSFGKPGPRNGRLDTCRLDVSFTGDDGTLIVADVTVLVSYTRR